MVQIPKSIVFYALSIILSFNPYLWQSVDKFLELRFKPAVKEEPTKLIIPNLFGIPPVLPQPENKPQLNKKQRSPIIATS